MDASPLRNWIPYKLVSANGSHQCKWLNTYGSPFKEPFFDETIIKCRALGSSHIALTPVSDVSMLTEWSSGLQAVEPNALIFHISRCGSTLISQMLATMDEHIVLPEVPFLDDLLRLPLKDAACTEATASALFTAALKYYGQRRTGLEKRLFIKTDSWHLFFYRQLRTIYPSVPFIFMYRRPDEVFSSHAKIAGMQAVPGLIEPELFGLTAAGLAVTRADIYLAKVLESYLSRLLEIAATDKNALLVNYSKGPMVMMEEIAAFINMPLSAQELQKMADRSRFDAKKPGERFLEEALTDTPVILREAMALYNQLEVLSL